MHWPSKRRRPVDLTKMLARLLTVKSWYLENHPFLMNRLESPDCFVVCIFCLSKGDFKVNCEFQRSCQGPGAINQAVVTCYHTSCTTIQRGQPLRMCQACHVVNHEGLQDDRHIYQGWSHLRRSQCSETQHAVLHTVEPLYRGHHWDPVGCPVYSGTSL